MQPAEEVVIEIHEHLKAEVQRLEILRQHYMQELQKLGQEMRQLFKVGHGVDIAEPGWRLDAEGGKIAYVPPQQPAEPPPGLHVLPNEQDD